MARERQQPVVIAGGGIGGLATALALAGRGLRSVVLEQRSQWSEAGAGLQLSPNGVRVLERLGVAGRLAPAAGVPEAIVVREARTGRVLQRLPLGRWVAERYGAPYWQVHRRDLQAALVEAVGREPLIEVRLGFDMAAFARNGDGIRVQARGAEDRSVAGRVLVGADGVFSRVRQQLWAPRAPRFSGWTAARTVIAKDAMEATGEGTDAATERGGAHDDPIDGHVTGVWLSPGAHAVHYPVRGGRELAVVVVVSEAWSGHGWSEPVEAAEIEAVLARLAPMLAAALGRGHSWRRWALFETEPLRRWSAGGVTLVGDAAHPTLPFLAQGGNLALEDAWELASALFDCGAGGEERALTAYDAARVGRANRVVQAARRNGQIFHLDGIAAMARDAVMRHVPGERMMARYDWVYGWRGQSPRA